MKYLLDSNICIDHLRKRGSGALRRKLLVVPASDIAVCSVVVAELNEGACRSERVEHNLKETRELLRLFHSFPLDDAVAERAGRLGAELKTEGEMLEQNDLYIAATALQHRLTLVTHNQRHFARVDGLQMEDWQASA